MVMAIITSILAWSQQTTLSALINTPYEALFITTAALTSLSLFNIQRWRLPAIFILLVAAFPYDKYLFLHHLWAGLFFLTSYFKILTAKRYNLWSFFAVVSLGLLLKNNFTIHGMLQAEIIAILSIVAHHIQYFFYRVKTSSRRASSSTSSSSKSSTP